MFGIGLVDRLRVLFRIGPTWSLKSKVFRIERVDRLRILFLDLPRVEPYKQGGVQDWMHGSSPRSVPDRPRIQA